MRLFHSLPALALALSLVVPAVGVAAPAAQAASGVVYGWGYNAEGQLGSGSTTNSPQPAAVAGLPDVLMVATGVTESVALAADRTVWRWGSGATRATQVPGLDNVGVVSVGSNHVLAAKLDGTLWAWGGNDFGQLGDGTETPRSTPVQVQGLGNVQAIAAGNLFSLAVTTDGRVWSWGFNIYGQLGNGNTNTQRAPAPVPGIGDVLDVAGGSHFSVAVKNDGTVWTWGRNDQGQLGNGTTRAAGAGRTSPVQVAGLGGVQSISAGGEFALAATADGSVWAWGENGRGQLGSGRVGEIAVNATRVDGVSGAVIVAASEQHALALLGDGSVAAWGNNFWGELGTGSRTTSGCWCIATPTTSALGGLGWVAAGRQHSLAMQVVNAGDGGAGTAPAVPAEEAQPAVPTPAQGTAPGGKPPLGQYGCTTFYSWNYAGDLVLLGGGAYVWYNEPGSYAYDAGTGIFTWLSGPVADLGYGGEFRATGSPFPGEPAGQTYGVDTVVLTGVAGSQEGDLISCEFEG